MHARQFRVLPINRRIGLFDPIDRRLVDQQVKQTAQAPTGELQQTGELAAAPRLDQREGCQLWRGRLVAAGRAEFIEWHNFTAGRGIELHHNRITLGSRFEIGRQKDQHAQLVTIGSEFDRAQSARLGCFRLGLRLGHEIRVGPRGIGLLALQRLVVQRNRDGMRTDLAAAAVDAVAAIHRKHSGTQVEVRRIRFIHTFDRAGQNGTLPFHRSDGSGLKETLALLEHKTAASSSRKLRSKIGGAFEDDTIQACTLGFGDKMSRGSERENQGVRTENRQKNQL